MGALGFIGGSGIYAMEGVEVLQRHELTTPFGVPSAPIVECQIADQSPGRFYFLARHGEGHTIGPSEINYRANIFGLKMLGVKTLVSLSAVGSLREELAPRDFFLPDQFIDWTKGLRKRTFLEGGLVGHVSCAQPVEQGLLERVQEVCQQEGVRCTTGGSYICIEGPQFSSRAESEIYRSFGASVIGMTNLPEAYLAKEAGIAYGTVAMVTDYDCWREGHCTLKEILGVLSDNYQSVRKIVPPLVSSLGGRPVPFDPENKQAVVTHSECISACKREVLEILFQ